MIRNEFVYSFFLLLLLGLFHFVWNTTQNRRPHKITGLPAHVHVSLQGKLGCHAVAIPSASRRAELPWRRCFLFQIYGSASEFPLCNLLRHEFRLFFSHISYKVIEFYVWMKKKWLRNNNSSWQKEWQASLYIHTIYPYIFIYAFSFSLRDKLSGSLVIFWSIGIVKCHIFILTYFSTKYQALLNIIHQ